MKTRVALSFVLAVGVLALAAVAQNPAGQPAAAKKDPLFFVKIAADVAGNVQQQALNDFLAIYLDEKTWESGLKDGDIGPFLKLQESKPGRSAACFFSGAKDVGICVFFDGETAFGVAAVKAGSSGQIDPKDVAGAFKPVSKEMLKKGERELHFEPSDAATDDGVSLPAFQVSTNAKFPS